VKKIIEPLVLVVIPPKIEKDCFFMAVKKLRTIQLQVLLTEE
jgi:hypothetical protein